MNQKIHGSFLVVPVYDGALKAHTASAIIQGYAAGLWRGYLFPGGDGISRARNHAAAAFLNTTAEWLDFIDNDICFTPENVRALRRHGHRDVVVGLYPKKTEQIALVYNSLPEGDPAPDANGLMEIAYGGTGFMRIHRSVFERMIAKHPEISYQCDFDGTTKWDFFPMGVQPCASSATRRYLTEDWLFCHRARALGCKIWADTTVELAHQGNAMFPLASEIARLKLQVELTAAQSKLAALEKAAA